jgi:hypothetical protein
MADQGLPVERLRQYLRQLAPETRALLNTKLESALLRGDEVPGGDFLLQEVRHASREIVQPAGNFEEAAHLFFGPVEPFLVDDRPERKHQGRIARAAIAPIWAWICRDLAVEAAAGYAVAVAGLAGQGGTAADDEGPTRNFQDLVAERIAAVLAAAIQDDKLLRRLIGQVSTPHAVEDIRTLAEILRARDLLAALASRLPGQIRNLSDSQLDAVKALLDGLVGRHRELAPYGLILVMGRLAAPGQLIRLAVSAAESDDAARIAATPYAAAVTVVLAEAERLVGELKRELKRGSGASITSLLSRIHDMARGLRSELDLSADSAWGRQLVAIRSEIADMLKAEIESMPGRVRRLLRPRKSSEIAPGSVLDAGDVADTEALIELVGACRNFGSELAIGEMTLRTYNELQQYLDTSTQALLDGLRGGSDSDRPYRQSQVAAAVRFCAKVFGKEYASLLTKAAEVAGNSERKVAARS